MGAVSEFPELIEDVFITDQKNDAGIYKLRFFIRGKPWVVTIDDEMLIYKTTTWDGYEYALNFAMMGES